MGSRHLAHGFVIHSAMPCDLSIAQPLRFRVLERGLDRTLLVLVGALAWVKWADKGTMPAHFGIRPETSQRAETCSSLPADEQLRREVLRDVATG